MTRRNIDFWINIQCMRLICSDAVLFEQLAPVNGWLAGVKTCPDDWPGSPVHMIGPARINRVHRERLRELEYEVLRVGEIYNTAQQHAGHLLELNDHDGYREFSKIVGFIDGRLDAARRELSGARKAFGERP